MTLTIDLTPQEEAWLNAQTRQRGISPAEIIRQLVDERIPGMNGDHSEENKSVLDPKRAAAIAYLDARIKEGENATPEEVRQATEEYEELQRNLNGIYPETDEKKPVTDPKRAAAIAVLQSWIEEGKRATPEEIRLAEEEVEELKRNLNANRAATGERLVFP